MNRTRRRCASSALVIVLSALQGCESGSKTAAPTSQQRSALEGICAPIPADYIDAEDGCDCPANGSTSCDPDCTQDGNPGGDWCGCEYCHVDRGGECAVIPDGYIGKEDGCDCPASGRTTCDPDCIEFGNPGGEWCGCEYCYGTPGGSGGTGSGGGSGSGGSGASGGNGGSSGSGGSSSGGSAGKGGSTAAGGSTATGGSGGKGGSSGTSGSTTGGKGGAAGSGGTGGGGGQCGLIPAEYLGADDGCDCPADGSTACDSDCADGNSGGEWCGCEYCYGEPGGSGGTGGGAGGGGGGQCAVVPDEYIGADDGCDCPANGDTSCDPDCADGNGAGEPCGCDYCYDVGGPGGGGPSAPPVDPFPPTPDVGIDVEPPFTDVPPGSTLPSEEVGVLPAGGAVDRGAFTYRIPINVPTGRAGMEPTVSLVYNSRIGDGPVGVGWSIQAASVITRCRKEYATADDAFGGYSRKVEGVQFDSTDALCLDGQRLMLVDGQYGFPNSEYRTEIDTFAKIEMFDTDLQGQPRSFQVLQKNGLVATYTSRHTSQLRSVLDIDGNPVGSSQSVVLAWPIERLADRSGNYIEYSYSGFDSRGMPLIQRIDYTRCTGSACEYSSPERSIRFGYAERPDPRELYVNGVRMNATERLTSITANVQDPDGGVASVSKYLFDYVQSGVSGRSLLKSVTLCDRADTCLPPTEFAWQGEDAEDGRFEVQGLRRLTQDFGGGIGGLAHLDGPVHSFSLVRDLANAHGRSFLAELENTVAVADINGDGNDDLLVKHWPAGEDGGISAADAPMDLVLLGDGWGYFQDPQQVNFTGGFPPRPPRAPDDSSCAFDGPVDYSGAQAVDLDMDGRQEVVAMMNDGCPFRLHYCDLQNGEFENCDFRVTAVFNEHINYDLSATSQQRYYDVLGWNEALRTVATRNHPQIPYNAPIGRELRWPQDRLQFLDLTGDGLPDMMQGETIAGAYWQYMIAESAPVGFDDFGLTYFSPNATPQQPNPETLLRVLNANPWLPFGYSVVDEDGDGRDELLQRDAAVYSSFTLDRERLAERRLADYPFDPVRHPLSFAETPPTLDVVGAWRFADINGDGLKDAVYLFHHADDFSPEDDGFHVYIRINTGAGYLPLQQHSIAMLDDYFWEVWDDRVSFQQKADVGLRLADMNGDGREDLVIMGRSGPTPERHGPYIRVQNRIRVIPSDGTEYAVSQWYELPNHGLTRLYGLERGWALSQIAELDGNGLPDIVDLAIDQDNSGKRQLITMTRPGLPGGTDLITEVHDAYGLAEEIDYGSLSWQSGRNGILTAAHLPDTVTWDEGLDYPPGTEPCVYPARCVARGAAVKYYENHRGQREIATSYRYAGARADVTGRGFLGFRVIREHDEVTGHYRHLTYDQSYQGSADHFGEGHVYLKLGAPSVESVYTHQALFGTNADLAPPEGEGLQSVVRRLWNFTDSAPYQLEYQRTDRELEELGGRTTWLNIVESTYDDYGNVTENKNFLRSDLGSGTAEYQTVLDAEFDIRENAWLVSLPLDTTVTLSTSTNPYRRSGCGGHACDTKVRRTSYTHDFIGRLESVTTEPSSATQRLVQSLERDGAGLVRVVTASAPDGTRRISKVDYDDAGLHPTVMQNPAGHVSFTLYDPIIDRISIATDANGVSTYLKYDRFGRLREEAGDDGSANSVSYGSDHVRTEELGGPQSTVFFDERGRPVVSAWSTFEGGTGIRESRYDSLGNVIQSRYVATSHPLATATASRSTLDAYLPAATQLMSARYDALGRLVSSTNGLDKTTNLFHSDFYTTVVTDPESFVREVSRDGRGSVITTLDRLERGPNSSGIVIDYRYEATGNLAHLSMRDEVYYQSTFEYDQFGRMTAQSKGLGQGPKSFVYSAFGELEQLVDRTTTLEFDYDALGRIIRREHLNPANGWGDRSTFTWDEGQGGVGRLHRASLSIGGSNEHRTEYAYDTLGRQSEVRELFSNGERLSLGYDYYEDGKLRSIRYPEHPDSADVANHPSTAGLRVRYEYRNGQIERISNFDTAEVLWRVEARHPFGMVTRASDRTGIASTTQYYPDTLQLRRYDVAGVSGGPLSQEFIYWKTGRLLVRNTGGSYSESFTYDGADRLTRYDRRMNFEGVGAEYVYSPTGDLRQVTAGSQNQSDWPTSVERYEYGQNEESYLLRRITVDPAVGANVVHEFEYDDAGRQVERTTEGEFGPFFEYNSFDLPKRIFSGSRNNEYQYDAFGTRVRKVGTSIATESVAYVGGLYEARDVRPPGASANVRQSVYRIFGDEGPLAEIIQNWGSTTETVSYLHTDQQGSIDSRRTGASFARSGYFPFGRRMGSYPNPPEVFASTGYTGHDHDDEFGLINMQGRMYDPRTRRFLTPDPVIAEPHAVGGINAYSYVLNDPVNLVDPTGFQHDRPPRGPEILPPQKPPVEQPPEDPPTWFPVPMEEVVELPTPGADYADFAAPAAQAPIRLGQQGTRQSLFDPSAGALACGGGGDVCLEILRRQQWETAKENIRLVNEAEWELFYAYSGIRLVTWPWRAFKAWRAARALAPLAAVLRTPGARGFSGVFDTVTGKLLLRPSTTALPTPAGWVARAGGHADVSAALGGNAANHAGFAVVLQQDGTLAVTWLSRTLNSGPGALVPAELRPAIVKAIEEGTGLVVSAF